MQLVNHSAVVMNPVVAHDASEIEAGGCLRALGCFALASVGSELTGPNRARIQLVFEQEFVFQFAGGLAVAVLIVIFGGKVVFVRTHMMD